MQDKAGEWNTEANLIPPQTQGEALAWPRFIPEIFGRQGRHPQSLGGGWAMQCPGSDHLPPAVTPYSAIDTWPGRRSGGMIVITSILGSLPFFLLVGFAGAIILSLV